MAEYRKVNPANGALRHGMRRVVVSFDEETFAQVRSVAVSKKVSFGEAVRQLVEFGLIDIGAEA